MPLHENRVTSKIFPLCRTLSFRFPACCCRGDSPLSPVIGYSEGTPRRERMKLLLIEDDEQVAQVLSDAFGADGHETAIRYSGEDGLAYLAHERPDAVVLDVRLPAIDGVGVLRQISATDQALPVIIMTGSATLGEIAEARRPGLTGRIEKRDVLH